MRLLNSRPIHYVAAGLFVAVALLIRKSLDPWLGDAHPLSLLFGAVALAVWLGGATPAVFAAILGYFVSDYLFIPPRGVIAVIDVHEAVGLLTYFISSAIIIGFGQGMRVANKHAGEYAQSLEQHKEKLERAEHHKDEFLATLAHELRNPLATIHNALGVLAHDGLRELQAKKTRQVIERQVGHLSRLIEDLLDIPRIATGRLHVQLARIDLATVLAEAVECARPLIDAAGHQCEFSLPTEPIMVQGDHSRLVQVFLNLLSNAVRYTPRGGHINIAVSCDTAWISVHVCDDGIGIPSTMAPRVFEMFKQLDRGIERVHGGLGIGLALVHRLVELHGGTINVHSEGAGTGSEFIVRLPNVAWSPTIKMSSARVAN
jgi:signal transduction histidine kinase